MTIFLLLGGGDLGTGVGLRLRRAGFQVLITELAQPLSVRRAVCFSEAMYTGEHFVEEQCARRAHSLPQSLSLLQRGEIAVLEASLLNPQALHLLQPAAIVDARLLKKQQPARPLPPQPLFLGLGPGFTAAENCHAAIETNRGHTLGRVLWQGSPSPDTRTPEGDPRRVLRAPAAGELQTFVSIGDFVQTGQPLAQMGGQTVCSPFDGVVRGLLRPGINVSPGLKLGDIDPRGVREFCFLVSDKALSIGGAVLEAALSYGLRP